MYTVKELYESHPDSVILVRGFGDGYPVRAYPREFSAGEVRKLNEMGIKRTNVRGMWEDSVIIVEGVG